MNDQYNLNQFLYRLRNMRKTISPRNLGASSGERIEKSLSYGTRKEEDQLSSLDEINDYLTHIEKVLESKLDEGEV